MLHIICIMHSIENRLNITKSAIFINPVHREDAGVYACSAKNIHGEAWLNFTLDFCGKN